MRLILADCGLGQMTQPLNTLLNDLLANVLLLVACLFMLFSYFLGLGPGLDKTTELLAFFCCGARN